jgi:predicted metal-binding protein
MKFDDIFQKPVKTQTERNLYSKDFKYDTKKISFSMHYKHKMISVEELKKFLVDDDTIIKHCTNIKPCANFSNAWSCPPVAPSFDKYNNGYKNCLVYAFWIDWDFNINSDNPYFKLVNANRTVSPYSWIYAMKLEKILEGKVAVDGRCPICRICMKKLGKPCAYPKKRRSSMEAIGIHATNVAKEVLDHEIQWYRKENGEIITPDYITCIHAFFTNSEQPKEMIQ